MQYINHLKMHEKGDKILTNVPFTRQNDYYCKFCNVYFDYIKDFDKHKCKNPKKNIFTGHVYCYPCQKYIAYNNYATYRKDNDLYNHVMKKLNLCDECKNSLNRWEVKSPITCLCQYDVECREVV